MVDGVGGPSRHCPETWAGAETPYGEVRERRDVESAGSRGAALPRGFKESGLAAARRPLSCGASPRSARAKSAAQPAVSSAAVRNAAPGKYNPAERAEKWPNTCVMSGGPTIELRL